MRKLAVPQSVRKNLIGKQFGRWLVDSYKGRGKHGASLWKCECSCSERTTRVIPGNALTTGSSTSCGCLRRERVREVCGKNLIGRTFGRLTVVREHPKRGKQREILWECICSCPDKKDVIVSSSNLESGHTRSCGCYNRDIRKRNLIGGRFGYLVPIEELKERSKQGSVMYLCRCECGRPHCKKTKKISSALLTSGSVKACGALRIRTQTELLQSRAVSVYRQYLTDATKRGLVLELSLEECLALFSKNCHYCGISPRTRMLHAGSDVAFVYNGIDRVNNLEGYLKTNAVPACSRCNRAKSDRSFEEFKRWIAQVYAYGVTKGRIPVVTE